jgi:ABC-type antimicrobial peptide transport system permease subunit
LLGVGAGLLASRVLESILYATPRTDPALMLASALVLAVAMLLACLLPARRAARLDPARTLTEP